jgi:Fur family ferric uptake transcriptional regulator
MDKQCHKDFFQARGLKNTQARDYIVHMLENQVMTAETIYLKIKKQFKKIALSTVYRIIDQFIKKGIIEKVIIPSDDEIYFQLASKHQHQLVCKQCHHVSKIEDCPLEEFEGRVQKKYHFNFQEHQLMFFGICQNCQPEK